MREWNYRNSKGSSGFGCLLIVMAILTLGSLFQWIQSCRNDG